jgi:hypothetical protein
LEPFSNKTKEGLSKKASINFAMASAVILGVAASAAG